MVRTIIDFEKREYAMERIRPIGFMRLYVNKILVNIVVTNISIFFLVINDYVCGINILEAEGKELSLVLIMALPFSIAIATIFPTIILLFATIMSYLPFISNAVGEVLGVFTAISFTTYFLFFGIEFKYKMYVLIGVATIGLFVCKLLHEKRYKCKLL